MSGVMARISTAKSDLSAIPTGTPGGGPATLTFNYPINASAGTTATASTYNAILGDETNAAS